MCFVQRSASLDLFSCQQLEIYVHLSSKHPFIVPEERPSAYSRQVGLLIGLDRY